MDTEHKALPLFDNWVFPVTSYGGAPPPNRLSPPQKERPKSIYPVLHRWIHRRHHIDRATMNATEPRTPPTPHVGGGACVSRAASLGLSRALFDGFDRSRLVGSRSRKKGTSLVSADGACHRRATYPRRPDVSVFENTIVLKIFFFWIKKGPGHTDRGVGKCSAGTQHNARQISTAGVTHSSGMLILGLMSRQTTKKLELSTFRWKHIQSKPFGY